MGPIGFPEMLVIMLLALLLFGPRKLPELGRTLGKGMAEFRKASTELKRTLNAEMIQEEIRQNDPRRLLQEAMDEADAPQDSKPASSEPAPSAEPAPSSEPASSSEPVSSEGSEGSADAPEDEPASAAPEGTIARSSDRRSADLAADATSSSTDATPSSS